VGEPRGFLFLPPLLPSPIMATMRAPRCKVSPQKRASGATPSAAAAFDLVPAESVPAEQKAWGSKNLLLLPRRDAYGPMGPLVQVDQLGSSGVTGDGGAGAVIFHPSRTSTGMSSHARKKENQWLTWMNVVIPSLLAPFLSLLRETDSL